jgi:hypothetical protein
MSAASYRRTWGALIWMLTTVIPPALFLLATRRPNHRHQVQAAVLLVLLPALSALISGSVLGAYIADRRYINHLGVAMLAGAFLAWPTAAIYCGLPLATILVWEGPRATLMGLWYGGGIVFFALIFYWTICVAMPVGALGAVFLFAIGESPRATENVKRPLVRVRSSRQTVSSVRWKSNSGAVPQSDKSSRGPRA